MSQRGRGGREQVKRRNRGGECRRRQNKTELKRGQGRAGQTSETTEQERRARCRNRRKRKGDVRRGEKRIE